MEITPLIPQGSQVIDGYGAGLFRIAGVAHDGSVLVFPDRTVSWGPVSLDGLTIGDFQPVIAADPPCDILLLGCGEQMAMPAGGLCAALRSHGITIDAMDTGAACRTFNVLLAEGRRVAAALIAL